MIARDKDTRSKAEDLLQQGINHFYGLYPLPKKEGMAYDCYEQASMAEDPKGAITEFFNGIKCLYGIKREAKNEYKAFTYFQESANHNLPVAQHNLARLYQNGGKGIEKDEKAAIYWYKKAIAQEFTPSLNNLGNIYADEKGIEKNDEIAVEWYRKAAEKKSYLGQYNLARMYENGRGVEQDAKTAVDWYQKSADQGYVEAQNFLGWAYQNGWGGVKKDAKIAVDWYRKAAEQGFARAQNVLGWAYQNSWGGVEKDSKIAVAWYRKAADQGYDEAQYNLAWMYEEEQGVEKDEKTAFDWYSKAAEQGFARAQNVLGWVYQNGWGGVEKDAKIAVEWYRKAAEQGFARAQNVLGWAYQNSWGGVEKDAKIAVEWYRKAADQGYDEAQYNLGRMYHRGEGVVEDEKTALHWYRKAAAQGNAEAQRRIDFISSAEQEIIAKFLKLRIPGQDVNLFVCKFVHFVKLMTSDIAAAYAPAELKEIVIELKNLFNAWGKSTSNKEAIPDATRQLQSVIDLFDRKYGAAFVLKVQHAFDQIIEEVKRHNIEIYRQEVSVLNFAYMDLDDAFSMALKKDPGWNEEKADPEMRVKLKKAKSLRGEVNNNNLMIEGAKQFVSEFLALFNTPKDRLLSALSVFLEKERSAGGLICVEKLDDYIPAVEKLIELSVSPQIERLFKEKIILESDLILLSRTDGAIINDSCSLIFEAVKFLGKENAREILLILLQHKELTPEYIPSLFSFAVQVGVDTKDMSEQKSDCKAEQAINGFFKEFVDVICQPINIKSWPKIKEKINSIILKSQAKKFPEKDIEVVRKEFIMMGADVEFPLDEKEVSKLVEQYKIINNYKESYATLEKEAFDRLRMTVVENLQKCPTDVNASLSILAIIREQIKRCFGVLPYNTQMLNVLAMINDPNGKRIAQIKTGEGKSTIIAVLSAFLALQGKKVDIITTSKDLAVRDVGKYRSFYGSLGISVSHNVGYKSKETYDCSVIYGTPSEFEFDYLKTKLGTSWLREKRKFDVVIVDEVDSMLLDTDTMPAKIAQQCDKYPSNLYQKIYSYMHDVKNELTTSALKKHLKSETSVEYSDEKVATWISNVYESNRLTQGKEYIVDKGVIKIVDFRHTGEIRGGLRWNDGLHSFLEVKHKLNINPEDFTSGQMNNFELFNLYQNIYGLTGTLGLKPDRDELKAAYGVSSYDSPSYRPTLKKCSGHIVVNDAKEKELTLKGKVGELVKAGRPVLVLCETINESKAVHALLKDQSDCVNIYNGLSDAEETKNDNDNDNKEHAISEKVLALAGNPKAITIATNKAGRGADITVTPQTEANGGLHVFITFSTLNRRVEAQGFGRTGRQGRPGSYCYLLDKNNISMSHKEVKNNSDELLGEWQKHRDLLNQSQVNFCKLTRACHHILFLAQKLFFALPDRKKQMLFDFWVEIFTEMDKVVRKFMDRHYLTPYSDIDVKIVADQVYALLDNGWQSYDKTNQIPSLMELAISSSDQELIGFIKAKNTVNPQSFFASQPKKDDAPSQSAASSPPSPP